MKKTMLRSFIIGLFAVVSFNASAYLNIEYLKSCVGENNLGQIYTAVSIAPYSSYYFEVDAYPNDNYDHTGDLVRVVWGPSFYHSGFGEGDSFGVYGVGDGGADMLYRGTGSVDEILVEVDSEGHFWMCINTGPTAGYREFGTICYWNPYFENYTAGMDYFGHLPLNWNVAWGWSPWVQ